MSVVLGKKLADDKVRVKTIHHKPGADLKSQGWEVDRAKCQAISRAPWEALYFNPTTSEFFCEKVREITQDDVTDFDVSSDKDQITADGVDTAVISVMIEPKELVNFYSTARLFVNNDLATSTDFATDGTVSFEFSSETTGTFQLQIDADGLIQKRIYIEAV